MTKKKMARVKAGETLSHFEEETYHQNKTFLPAWNSNWQFWLLLILNKQTKKRKKKEEKKKKEKRNNPKTINTRSTGRIFLSYSV